MQVSSSFAYRQTCSLLLSLTAMACTSLLTLLLCFRKGTSGQRKIQNVTYILEENSLLQMQIFQVFNRSFSKDGGESFVYLGQGCSAEFFLLCVWVLPLKRKISCDCGANGIQKIASFKSNTEYQVLMMQSSQQGVRLGITGCISQVASLTTLRSCTLWYSPLGFFIGKMGVLQDDWHGPIRPWSFRFCVTEVMPNKASRQREGLILYWIMFVLS